MESGCRISGSQALSWALFHTGQIRKLIAPEEAAAHAYTPREEAIIAEQSKLWIVGSADSVKAEIAAKAEAAGADEVMIATTVWDYTLRQRSYALLAQAFGLSPATA